MQIPIGSRPSAVHPPRCRLALVRARCNRAEKWLEPGDDDILLPPGRPAAEVGLPITISLPAELELIPGETLDIRRVRK